MNSDFFKTDFLENTSSWYIHIPYCISKCRYCDFFSIENRKNLVPDEYVSALCKEIEFRKNLLKASEIKTIYIGGGTPSLLTNLQFSKIMECLFKNVKLSEKYEFTIEVNPDDVNPELLKSFEENKINRISCGIQSLNDKALKFAGRRASEKENLAALECFKNYWKKDLSLDLICGLPEETKESFILGIKKIITYNPSHISMYSLTIEDETPFGKMLNSHKLKYDFDWSDDLWLEGKENLEKNGYEHYEVSNFCKKGKECNHNLIYWNHENYAGCGSGGTGSVYKKDGSGYRWTNTNKLSDYISFWNNFNENQITENGPDLNLINVQETENVDVDTSKFEFFMMGLRKISGISENQYERTFGEKIPENVITVFEKWQKKGLCQIENKKEDNIYTLGKKGILFLNAFLEELL